MCSTSLLYKISPTSLVACKPAFYTFYTSHLRYTVLHVRCAVFFIQTSDRFCSFLPYFLKPVLLQFSTILQDKLHSFIIQDDRSTRFLCTTNHRIDYIIKRFHEDCSVRTICSYVAFRVLML